MQNFGNGLFSGIGKKIKAFSVALFWVETIASVIAGLLMIIEGADFGGEELIFGGIVTTGLGWVAAWVMAIFPYGFGELVDRVMRMEKGLSGTEPDGMDNFTAAAPSAEPEKRELFHCPKCGGKVYRGDERCSICGVKMNWDEA